MSKTNTKCGADDHHHQHLIPYMGIHECTLSLGLQHLAEAVVENESIARGGFEHELEVDEGEGAALEAVVLEVGGAVEHGHVHRRACRGRGGHRGMKL